MTKEEQNETMPYSPDNKGEIKEKSNVHFLHIAFSDTVYHIGASLKDLGKKLFAFSKMQIKANEFAKLYTI